MNPENGWFLFLFSTLCIYNFAFISITVFVIKIIQKNMRVARLAWNLDGVKGQFVQLGQQLEKSLCSVLGLCSGDRSPWVAKFRIIPLSPSFPHRSQLLCLQPRWPRSPPHIRLQLWHSMTFYRYNQLGHLDAWSNSAIPPAPNRPLPRSAWRQRLPC